MNDKRKRVGLAAGSGAVAVLCAAWMAASGARADAAPEWRSLLAKDGAPDWRGYVSEGVPAGWHVENGVLSKQGPVEDLISKKNYGNFELELEWKLGAAGNSGVFYRGTRQYDHIYWSGPEYQLLDDAGAPDGASRLTSAAAAYGLYGPPAGVVKAHDEWNRTRIVVNGNHVEHWLNGRKVVEYELKSADWRAKVAASKFKAYPNYGLAPSGLIGIQGDHNGPLWVRNIRIRELP